MVTPRDLCWHDTKTCRVDVRVFDDERKAALAAAAAGDDDGILRHASAAIAAYRGELLPGVYDDWLLDARAQLERQCVDLCDLACAARARTGDLAGAVEAARRRVQLQPLEEVGYRTLMELQADLGDRAGAVSTYHHCASVLERELGVAPDPSTRRAFQRLMAQRPPGGTAPGRRQPERPAAPDWRRPSLSAGPLSSARCKSVWRAAVAGRRGLVLVRGGAAWGRPVWWRRWPRWHGCRARWSRRRSASGQRDGWRWPRWRSGCGTMRSSRRRRPSIPLGVPKSAGSCRPVAAVPAPGRRQMPGNVTASWKAWPGR